MRKKPIIGYVYGYKRFLISATTILYLSSCSTEVMVGPTDQAEGLAYNTALHSYTLPTNRRNLTYHVDIRFRPQGVNGQMTDEEILSAIRKGLSIWSSTCRISFRSVASAADANVRFVVQSSAAHSNVSPYGQIPTTVSFNVGHGNNSVMCANDFIYLTLHETGHVLGLWDMQQAVWSSCSMDDGTGHAPMPTPRGAMNDGSYWDWRMRGFQAAPNSCSAPNGYNFRLDTRVSIMDYDCLGKAYWRPNNLGFWGRGLLTAVGEANIQLRFRHWE